MEKIKYFDYRKVAKKMSVPDTILRKIEKEVKDVLEKTRLITKKDKKQRIRVQHSVFCLLSSAFSFLFLLSSVSWCQLA